MGSIDVSNLYGLGMTSGVRLEALPFGNMGATGNIALQRWDPISGGPLGWLLNPGASSISMYNNQGNFCMQSWSCGFGGSR